MFNEYRLGKYKFMFVAPRKTSDAYGYYSLKSIQGIPMDFIRLYFLIKKCNDAKQAERNSVSIPTWEAIRGKFIFIIPHKVKEGFEEVQEAIMEDLEKLIIRIYRQSQITIIPIEIEKEDGEEQEIE